MEKMTIDSRKQTIIERYHGHWNEAYDVEGVSFEKKTGKEFAALCPFHDEKTPSFFVNAENGKFKCFGCNEAGDFFTFFKKIKNLNDFNEVLGGITSGHGVNVATHMYPVNLKQGANRKLIKHNSSISLCKKEESPNIQELSSKFTPLFNQLKNNPFSDKANEFLKFRGVIMMSPFLKAQGLIGYNPKKEALVFPMMDPETGDVIGLQNIHHEREKKERYRIEYDSNMKEGVMVLPGDGQSVIVECVIDGLSAKLADDDYEVVILFSANGLNKLEEMNLKEPIFLFDNDEVGKKATEEASKLFPQGFSVCWDGYKEGTDVNDVLIEKNIEGVMELLSTAKRINPATPLNSDPEEKYQIEYEVAKTGEITQSLSQVLARNTLDNTIYRFGSSLVSVVKKAPTTIRDMSNQYPKMTVIVPLTIETLRHEVEKRTIIQRKNKRGLYDILVPDVLLKGLMALPSPEERPLTGIIEHPYIDENMQPVVKNGYDPDTGLVQVCDSDVRVGYDPEEAFKYIIDTLFCDVPFESRMDCVASVAMLLTGMQRKMIHGDSGCPGFLISAPVQSSGKTTLAQIVNYALYGRPAAVSSFSKNDEEMGKHLLGILREGHSSILFDNLPQGTSIDSNELSMAMTSNTYSKRLLGENKTVTVPSSVLWIFTGNNVYPSGDFNTRILPIRLDARVENPDQRSFKYPNIQRRVLENRNNILSACMTIIAKAGMVDISPSRYPEWDKYVRYPLYSCTGMDIGELFQRNKNADPKIEGQRILFEAWHSIVGDTPITAAKAIEKARGGSHYGNALGDAMRDVFNGDIPSTLGLGCWLRGFHGRIIDGYKIISTVNGSRGTRGRKSWAVSTIE